VTFSDLSSGQIDSYLWGYGDGITGTASTVTHTHTYTGAGVYTTSLTVEGSGGSDTLTRTNYITAYLPLTVTGTSPMSNGLVIAPDGVISATFGRAISNSTVSTRTFTVWGKQTGVYEGEYTFGSVRFAAYDDFKPGEELLVNLSQDIQALDGAPLTAYAWAIQTAAAVGGSSVFSDSGQTLGSSTSQAVALGDLDGDGDLDALVGNYTDDQIWLNDGAAGLTITQTFGTGAQDVALGDLDCDGDLDAFVADYGPNQVWLNEGSGVFTSGQSLGNTSSLGVALGYLDGDEHLDVFIANGDQQADEVWLNDGTGVFTLTQSLEDASSEDVALGDLDGDGRTDALVVNTGANQVWLNDGSGVFTSGQSFGSGGVALALGDLDGDGDLDALVRETAASRVWLNDGTGAFSLKQSLEGSDTFSWSLDLGDLDGDGDLDVFLANEGDDVWTFAHNEIWLNDGSGGFTCNQSMAHATSTGVDLGDLDGDKDLDALIANSGANQVWLNVDRPLWAVIQAQPGTVLVGQPIQVGMGVTNVGDVPVDDVQPWLEADGAYLVSGPQPISATLGASESVTFSLVYSASESSTLVWQGYASGIDGMTYITTTSATTASNPVAVVGTGRDWIQRQPASAPSPRDEAALAYDSGRGVVVLFGGLGESGRLSDTWE
jgi:PKD repeat protein